MNEKIFSRLVEIINDYFGEPFLPKNHVRARLDEKGMEIFIGSRDVHISWDGRVLGAGTNLRMEEKP